VDAGKSFRTHNHNRATIVSLAEWLVEAGRLRSNPLVLLPKKNEARDRRRVRRAATDEELAALLAVPEAMESGRSLYYLFAALPGLRVKAVTNATWSDIDFEAGTIRVRVASAKGKREDQYFSLHPQLIEELVRMKPHFIRPHDRIFRTIPRVKKFHRDCERAGVA
jgi:integrase